MIQRIDEQEKKRRFVALANKRVNKTLLELEKISKLANKHSYSYTEGQAEQIVCALNEEIKNIRSCFKLGKYIPKKEFLLDK